MTKREDMRFPKETIRRGRDGKRKTVGDGGREEKGETGREGGGDRRGGEIPLKKLTHIGRQK